MKQFTLYCTAEETRRAYTLGAPIEERKCSKSEIGDDAQRSHYMKQYGLTLLSEDEECDVYGVIPTVEQMCGWLRTTELLQVAYVSRLLKSFVKSYVEDIHVDINEALGKMENMKRLFDKRKQSYAESE